MLKRMAYKFTSVIKLFSLAAVLNSLINSDNSSLVYNSSSGMYLNLIYLFVKKNLKYKYFNKI